jgi:hypothetical protein
MVTEPLDDAFITDSGTGLSKREYMAIRFMAAMLANPALAHEASLHLALCSLDAVFALTNELNREIKSCK